MRFVHVVCCNVSLGVGFLVRQAHGIQHHRCEVLVTVMFNKANETDAQGRPRAWRRASILGRRSFLL